MGRFRGLLYFLLEYKHRPQQENINSIKMFRLLSSSIIIPLISLNT